MRILKFNGSEKAAQRYEILYDGLVNTQRGFGTAELRIHSRILDKMEAIGQPTERGGIKTFGLNPTSDGCVELEDVEYKLLDESIQDVRWNAKASRMVSDALDFLSQAERYDVTK